MSKSRKRLVKNERETSNHTLILEDEEENQILDIEEFAYKPQKKEKNEKKEKKMIQEEEQFREPQQSQEKQKMYQTLKSSVEKQSVEKKQTSLMQFMGQSQKKIKSKDDEFDISRISIQEQMEIEKQIMKSKQPQKFQSNQPSPPKRRPSPQDNQFENAMFKTTQQLAREMTNKKSQHQKPSVQPQVQKPYVQFSAQKSPNKNQEIKSMYMKAIKPLVRATDEPKEKQSQQTDTILKSDILKGLTIVLTGLISICSREALEKLLKDNGAKVTGQVSGKTNYLICGEKLEDGRKYTEGRKYKTAIEKKTKIIIENDLEEYFMDWFGKKSDELFEENATSKLYKKSQQVKTLALQQKKDYQLLADKYMPQSLDELIENKSSVSSFYNWLLKFYKRDTQTEQKKKKFISMNLGRYQPIGNDNSKACMISGPPGIGKSSMVRLVAQALNLKIVVSNASDQRNKKSVKELLNDLVDNTILMNRFRVNKEYLILMDEVDGMTGSDRGGIAALIECIKNTQIPIVCICNDNENRKLMSLLTHCYHIKFQKPEPEQVAKRLSFISKSENLRYSIEDLKHIAICCDGDVRQCLNVLQGNLKFSKDKVSVLNIMNAAQSLLNKKEREQLNLREMLDMYFLDSDLVPLIIQDSYLLSSCQDLEKIAQAAELISESDVLSRCIRQKQQWSLMPAHGLLSSVFPSCLSGESLAFPRFPSWLGKNSSARKTYRESLYIKQMISSATYLASDINLYAQHIMRLLKKHMIQDNIAQTCEIMDEYNLNPELLKVEMVDLQFLKIDPFVDIPPAKKAQLTRYFNQRHIKAEKRRGRVKEAEQGNTTLNYNPLVGEEAPLIETVPQENEENEEEDKQQSQKRKQRKQTKKRSVSKNKQKASNKMQTESSQRSIDSDESDLSGFIVDDDDV